MGNKSSKLSCRSKGERKAGLSVGKGNSRLQLPAADENTGGGWHERDHMGERVCILARWGQDDVLRGPEGVGQNQHEEGWAATGRIQISSQSAERSQSASPSKRSPKTRFISPGGQNGGRQMAELAPPSPKRKKPHRRRL